MDRTFSSALVIRELSEHAELAEAVQLQQEVWGFQDIELLPLRLFVVAGKIGGQILGAFDGPRLVAFCLCIPGLQPGGKPYLPSHMLGVLAPYRNSGLGRVLKWKQRDFALAKGVDLIEWTFDPLESKNAFFNIERLGAVARRYVYNQYGSTSSHLHGGLPTDRLIAEWWIGSDRVCSASQSGSCQRALTQRIVTVPSNIEELRVANRSLARSIQERVATQLEDAFREGLAVTGYDRSAAEGSYLLSLWPSK